MQVRVVQNHTFLGILVICKLISKFIHNQFHLIVQRLNYKKKPKGARSKISPCHSNFKIPSLILIELF